MAHAREKRSVLSFTKHWKPHTVSAMKRRSQSRSSSEIASDEECEYPTVPRVSTDIEGPLKGRELWLPVPAEEDNLVSVAETIGRDSLCSSPDGAGTTVVIEEYHGSAEVKFQSHCLYNRLMLADRDGGGRNTDNFWYPFSCHMEWQVFKWLSSLRDPMGKINEFFNLEYVCLNLFC